MSECSPAVFDYREIKKHMRPSVLSEAIKAEPTRVCLTRRGEPAAGCWCMKQTPIGRCADADA